MGDIKRKKSRIRKPKKPFDKLRIDEEKGILKKYGLKNKKEIWKAEGEISKLRRRAKALIPKSEQEREEFFEKLKKLGFKINETADVLGLTKNDWLNRRLQTVIFQKGLANSIKQARQLIIHKKVFVEGKAVNRPSFIVTTDLENKIVVKNPVKKKIKKESEGKKEIEKENKQTEKQETNKEKIEEVKSGEENGKE